MRVERTLAAILLAGCTSGHKAEDVRNLCGDVCHAIDGCAHSDTCESDCEQPLLHASSSEIQTCSDWIYGTHTCQELAGGYRTSDACRCAFAGGCATGGESEAESESESESEGQAGPGGPVIASLGASATSITDGQMVTFTATVTDPDGAADLAGGVLTDGASVTYGPFTLAGGSTWSFALSWSAINTAHTIEFTGTQSLTLLARFSDMEGHTATRPATLTLTCEGGGACGGRCVDLMNDSNNCGRCRQSCSPCMAGSCAAWSDCSDLCSARTGATGPATCASLCDSLGGSCVESACDGLTGEIYLSDTCSGPTFARVSGACDRPFEGPSGCNVAFVRCCCAGTTP